MVRRALPAVLLVALATPAVADEKPVPWLGITFHPASQPLRVTEVFPRTTAARAGIMPGDHILAIADDAIHSADYLRYKVTNHDVGQLMRVTVLRDGREVTLIARVTAKPPSSELLEQRLVGAPLPPMAVDDGPLDGQPTILTVFDAQCEPCAAAASALAERARERGLRLPVRAVVVGKRDEIRAYLSRNPVAGQVSAWEVAEDDVLRGGAVLSGLNGERNRGVFEGAVLVVDHAGIVQFAASTDALDEVAAGALAAAARVEHRGRRGSLSR